MESGLRLRACACRSKPDDAIIVGETVLPPGVDLVVGSGPPATLIVPGWTEPPVLVISGGTRCSSVRECASTCAATTAKTGSSRSPNLNAYAERFVGSIKSECLRHIVPIGERHLRAVVREYVEHYHHERNHQGLDNVIPLPLGQPGKGAIRRHERLGGVPGHYRRDAA